MDNFDDVANVADVASVADVANVDDVIRSNIPGSFPYSVLRERHPALIQRVRDAFPYDPERQRALGALLRESTDPAGVMEPLPADARDREQWEEWGSGEHVGGSWFDAPFLWAESYFYRRLLDAVGYFDPAGPWQGIDPFRPFKQAELRSPEAQAELTALDRLAQEPPETQGRALLHGSLWGNRADLGFQLTANATDAPTPTAPLLADDSNVLWSLLPPGAGNTIHVVADNAGRELVPDLLLIDHFLRHAHADHVVLHVKPHPYYVSDATPTDVIDALRHLKQAPGEAGDAGERLWCATSTGHLQLRTHPFSCAPLPYAAMPDDLKKSFETAALTILKGDLNYRRLVGDQLWAPTTPFPTRTSYFPSPVAALRTLKSDVVVGLDAQTEGTLNAAEPQNWRTKGTHAVIQVRDE
ncbi:damage-control phosphatase ARMT1 family protein [Streptomyces sp. NPDC058254]|uniref:damage-control phosphatase ARMT1 family protein n=1 Tax=Streptomyces sp. NPDC058254 TaxID=3346406 RepID=UPI0036E81067